MNEAGQQVGVLWATLLSAVIVLMVVEWGSLIFLDFVPQEFWNHFWISRLAFPFLTLIAPAVVALAVSYIWLKIYRRRSSNAPPNWHLLLMVAGLSPIVICSAFMSYSMYAAATFPSPKPYPGTTAEEVGVRSVMGSMTSSRMNTQLIVRSKN